MKKFKIITLGCKVNTYESEVMTELLEKNNFIMAQEQEIPDIIIVNTCAVTSVAGQKSRQMLHREKKKYPSSLIIAVGCYSQLDGVNIDGVDIVLGTNDKNKLIEKINDFYATKEKQVLIDAPRKRYDYEKISIKRYEENTRAFVKIQDGCDNFCSYCIIPYTRGKARSREEKDILNEIHELVNNGYQEIVLTGIDLASYGENTKHNFVALLKDILTSEPNLKRLRISSVEASQINDEFINLLLTEKRIASHLHIPLQSGSKNVLKKMNRKYTKEEFYEKIMKIKKANPLIALACDVIVGFPEETEEEFIECMDFINKCGFNYLHVFPYSLRPGTVASKMKQIPYEIKKDRARRLIAFGKQKKEEYYKKFDNQELEVLFETCLEDGITWKGYTENYIEVKVKSSVCLHNKMKKVIYKYKGNSILID